MGKPMDWMFDPLFNRFDEASYEFVLKNFSQESISETRLLFGLDDE